jgi:type I restriction enzyme S subunit
MRLPTSWLDVRLADICELNPRLSTTNRPSDDATVTFVPMAAVDEKQGIIAQPEIRSFAEVAKGYTSFRENDVLFAKVTPCMENGKAAIAKKLENGLGFGSTEFHVLRPSAAVLPEYLFSYIRQKAFRERAASALVGTGGLQRVPSDFISRVKIPLPPLTEQQRIVDILHHSNQVAALRRKYDLLLKKTKMALFVELFGDPNPKYNDKWPVVKLGKLIDIGTGGTPSRQRSDNYGSDYAWVKSTDLKDSSIKETEEKISKFGIQRSNAKLYPPGTILLAMYGQGQTRGRTGKLLIEACCNQACAALLPNENLLSDYLLMWFQLSYDAVRSLGRGGQQENLNLNIIRGIEIPRPPVPLQQEFARRLAELSALEEASYSAKQKYTQLLQTLQVEALSGEATKTWRTKQSDEQTEAIQPHDLLLRRPGTKAAPVVEQESPKEELSNVAGHERHWLQRELSEFQRQILIAFSEYCQYSGQPLIVEDPEVFSRFCDDDSVTERLEKFGDSLGNHIRRTLSQLASLGLIAKIALPKQNAETGEREYLKAFRPLRSDELTRMTDLQQLRKALSNSEENTLYFEAELDYESSSSAGADGMFQVISLTDHNGQDTTNLIDQGVHYSSLDDIRSDIADGLGVSKKLIVLEVV